MLSLSDISSIALYIIANRKAGIEFINIANAEFRHLMNRSSIKGDGFYELGLSRYVGI
jgi:hypothetical protein